MELFLNLAWAALAIVLVCAWMHTEDGSGRRRRIVALAALIAILLPVISISDDLLAIQNAVETDTCQRRQQITPDGGQPLSSQFPAALPATMHQGITVANLGFAPPPAEFVPEFDHPGLPRIQNRPPPAA